MSIGFAVFTLVFILITAYVSALPNDYFMKKSREDNDPIGWGLISGSVMLLIMSVFLGVYVAILYFFTRG